MSVVITTNSNISIIIDIKIIGYTASMRFKEYKTEYTKKLINAGADIIAKTSEEIFKIIVD